MKLKSYSLALSLFVFASVILLAKSKVFHTNLDFKSFLAPENVRTKYIGRMGFEVGDGSYVFNAKLKNPLTLKDGRKYILAYFYGIIDDDYERFQQGKTCGDKLRLARIRVEYDLPVDGTPIKAKVGKVTQNSRTRMWYFVASECFEIIPENLRDSGNVIETSLELRNSDGSHLTQEENGLLMPHIVMTAIFLFFFGHTLMKVMNYYKKEEQHDYPLLMLDVACFLEFLALSFESLHLTTTIWYGESAFGLDFLSSVFSVLAQFVMTLLLILIATGWSISYSNIEDLDLLLPMAALVAILHLVFAIVGKVGDDDPLKKHDYDNWAGVVLVVVRVFFFAIFMGFAINTYQKAPKKIQSFVLKIILIGMVYLLTIPVVVTIATIFIDHLWRHKVITLGNMILQSVTVMLFAFQFTTKGSSYNSVSLKNSVLIPSYKAD